MEMTKKGEWLEIIIPSEWHNISIEDVLKDFFQVAKKPLHQLRMDKGVKINDELFPWTKPLSEGEVFQIKLFPTEDYGVVPTEIPLEVLYEDDHLLIVNKQAGIDTHPSDGSQSNTLSNAVANYFQKSNVKTKVRHIHRLDKDTSGAILFAKHAVSGAILDKMLEQRIIKRTYIALVMGQFNSSKGTIDKPIGKDRHHATRRRVSPTGQSAKTNYEVLQYDEENNTSLVKLQLETGRTHQIRVHMSHIGHPLNGDTLYAGKRGNRQALHAAKIEFPHPIGGEKISCIAPFNDKIPLFHFNIEEI
ncbi:RNA pseudouridine synthase [Lottiidibacillus patelloidae]|uniref:Pseudouridine synthase n=1 Tax=Lottiidibacillus patelloidae TaxID=2670334 RepID=A0A263BRF3_9BACI|nr:RluA family pseudouridine synthase [Lottiidibacillus patelloidae]OZM56280.1 RNA pseudouridine synthase [Lottiidibacillus patelloidae]